MNALDRVETRPGWVAGCGICGGLHHPAEVCRPLEDLLMHRLEPGPREAAR